ncbi:MAG: hypothetical protein ABEI97_05580 [Candidatus Nanohaloarchaea archaeon]
MTETFTALFGLATTLTAHTYFYLTAYSSDSGFTGLLEKEESVLMDSMVAIGGIQVVYFLWRYLETAFTTRSGGTTAVTLIGLVLLAVFFYHSTRLIDNMQAVRKDRYGFEVDLA